MQRLGTYVVLAALLPSMLFSQTIAGLRCHSDDPDWVISFSQDMARFDYDGRGTDFDIVHQTNGLPGPWPIALTLIADRDTAIVIADQSDGQTTIDILTQRGTTPVLLTGKCQ